MSTYESPVAPAVKARVRAWVGAEIAVAASLAKISHQDAPKTDNTTYPNSTILCRVGSTFKLDRKRKLPTQSLGTVKVTLVKEGAAHLDISVSLCSEYQRSGCVPGRLGRSSTC
jgi:hypothetical protein